MSVDTMFVPLLQTMVHRSNHRPASGLVMPPDFTDGLAQKGFDVAEGTVPEGNCGIHGFIIGLLEAAQRGKVLSNTSQLKQARKLRGDLKALIGHARRSASNGGGS